MTTLSAGDVEHLFEKLRTGAVPERGLDAIAVGIEAERAEIARQLDHVVRGEGSAKFLRGDYGCGKTFMARLTQTDAWAAGFATSFLVVGNDLRFHEFEDLYARVVSELSTATCHGGALGDILDRWIGAIEDELADTEDDESPEFAGKVRARIARELERMTAGKAPIDFVRVIQRIFDLKEAGDFIEAGTLLSWLSGSRNVAASAKRQAGIKGDISSRDALNYLRGVVEIVRAAGYRGLVIIVDETETLSHGRTDTLRKALNGLRHIVDKAGEYPGLLWVFTGTPLFFDDKRRGVAALQPLHDRIQFSGDAERFANLRQPQLRLRPFDADRLERVARGLRSLYPNQATARRLGDDFIGKLVRDVTAGFGGDVGVVPRQFLRAFVNVLDTMDQHADYDPMVHYAFKVTDETDQERAKRTGIDARIALDDDDGPIEEEDIW